MPVGAFGHVHPGVESKEFGLVDGFVNDGVSLMNVNVDSGLGIMGFFLELIELIL